MFSSLTYKRILTENDDDIDLLLKMYQIPSISHYLSISGNYFHYVTNTENVYFYKIYEHNKLIGTIHLEKQADSLYMDILIFPEFQREWVLQREWLVTFKRTFSTSNIKESRFLLMKAILHR